MDVIDINQLTKHYRNKKLKKIEALNGLNLKVRQGEVMGFLGPNGAGKSTTIKMLVGLIRPTAGQISVMGLSPLNPQARGNIGFLPENPALYDFLSAREYLYLIGRSFYMDGQQLQQCCEQVLEIVDLTYAAKRAIRTYSKGMIQRLGIAQTLVHDPDVYILDEPMSGLDPVGRAMVKNIILDLKHRGKTVFFSTHITSDVESVCDRVAMLKGGELQSVDVVADLMEQGITSYHVRFLDNLGVLVDVNVDKENLSVFLRQSIDNGHEIVLVEPCRKTLEEIFLNKIN